MNIENYKTTFAEELEASIERNKKSMRCISQALGIPYRTLQEWKAGTREPAAYLHDMILSFIENCKIYVVFRDDGTIIKECESMIEARETIAHLQELDYLRGFAGEGIYAIANQNYIIIE